MMHIFEEDNEKEATMCLKVPCSDKFLHIDKTVIENLTVGDIHSTFPNMADYRHWKSIGSKSWADPAYGELKDTFENTTIELVS